jgi:hypothetical protein
MIFGCSLTTSGSSTASYRPLDKVYTLGVREDKYMGASEFQGLPVCDINCQPINISSRTLYFALGLQNTWQDTYASLWLRDSNLDVISSADPTTGRDVVWSFTTSDDISSDQSAKLRHLETHCYVSGRGNNQIIPYAVTIDCNIYTDVGVYVTIARALKTFPLYKADINFDKRIEGQRIRYQFTFTNSYLVVNGCTSYYVSYDKACSPADRENTEYSMQVEIGTLSAWLTRTSLPIDVVTGRSLAATGTVSRITGPDGRVLSGYSTVSSANYLTLINSGLNVPVTSTTWQIGFWVLSVNTRHYVLQSNGTPSIGVVVNAGGLTLLDGQGGGVATTLTAGTGWSFVLITYTAGAVVVMQDNVLCVNTANTINASIVFGNKTILLLQGGGSIADLRIKDGTASAAAWTYYFGDVPDRKSTRLNSSHP